MSTIILVTGGCRSGKSEYAEQLAEAVPGSRGYVATCPVVDDEMRDRIAHHQARREGLGWETLEEQTDLSRLIANNAHDVLLVDCITLWVSNLMYQAQQAGSKIDEDIIRQRTAELLATCRKHGGTIVFVTNEVGLGVVPDNALARQFRDLVGRCNQTLAAEADDVVFISCGLPVTLKKGTADVAS